MYVCMYIYIYIYRQKIPTAAGHVERISEANERTLTLRIYIYIYTHMHIHIYIHANRKQGREHLHVGGPTLITFAALLSD